MRRREFLTATSLGGAATLLGVRPTPASAEPPPETNTLTLTHLPTICFAPQYVAEDLLRGEGFTDVRYVKLALGDEFYKFLGSANVNLTMDLAASQLVAIDDGDPLVILAGVHVGCYQLFGTNGVRTVRDLKGKTVAVPALRSGPHLLLSMIAANIGLDPRKDITWVEHPGEESMALLGAGKVDAFLGFPPEPQELRAKKIGQLVLNTATDKPWSQYFCCVVSGQPGVCAQEPRSHQASAARHPEGDGHLRPRACAGRSAPRGQGLRSALRLRPAGPAGCLVREVARVQPRGYSAFPSPPPPRARNDQDESAEARGPGDRLALPQRAQAGAQRVDEAFEHPVA